VAPPNLDGDSKSPPTTPEFGAGAAHEVSIPTVTEALWQLLQREIDVVLPGVRITARSPDKAREAGSGSQINLFLYQVLEDRGRAEFYATSQHRSNLALSLHYLVTAYGPDDHEINSTGHALLNEAMRILHGNPVLAWGQQGSVDPVRIHVALHPMTLDDLSKLWATFQTPYQLSVVYEVASLLVGDAAPSPVPR
jgi:hypothetical protein